MILNNALPLTGLTRISYVSDAMQHSHTYENEIHSHSPALESNSGLPAQEAHALTIKPRQPSNNNK